MSVCGFADLGSVAVRAVFTCHITVATGSELNEGTRT